ncbi:fucose isomerase [Martelella alba]|uniref:Fucose isomerase n=1 Tax=Martelella alba TaxID=2590451 RepID=A0A506U3E4_9HYPH|nr:fucose isomerase [Martelella alba]TPW28913.1 fucose isomerase [Martelella alba]
MTRIALVVSGDLRESANTTCWPAQKAMEDKLSAVLAGMGHELWRAHPVKPEGHGFIASQREGMDVFKGIDPDMPLIVAEAVWQYSHHVLPGLSSHKGPILTLANWSGQYPGLVGMLNLNGSLTKAGIAYSTLWSRDFDDTFFLSGLKTWLETGTLAHDQSHVKAYDDSSAPDSARATAKAIADEWRSEKLIMGIFDEGCMGMYNAIIPDELLMPLGIFKERLSQSALYYAATQVPVAEGRAAFQWMVDRGMTFHFGFDPKTELTEDQVIDQCRMYVAAVRLADQFGCAAIGIQYQQGLKDLWPASDLIEGMLNNAERPPVTRADGSVIRDGEPVIHFNEVDECAGLDALMINRVHAALGQPVETTLHDIRWGDDDLSGTIDEFVWVLEISGAAPPAHHPGGWAGSESYRQPAMFFPAGGGTVKGYAKEGDIVWSRVFVEGGKLHMDIGRGKAVTLPPEECERRSKATDYPWPIMSATLSGVTRDTMMGRHKANHVQVAYAKSEADAQQVIALRAALATELGIAVNLCGMI